MNTFQTTLAYVIAALTLTAFLWACVRALRKRFAGEPCTGEAWRPTVLFQVTSSTSHITPDATKRILHTERLVPAGPDRTQEEYTYKLLSSNEEALSSSIAHIKSLSDADLWAMKGLSKPLAKIRKTEMDVRRRRKARATAARRDVIGHTSDGRTVFFDHNGSPTLRDPLGWDANGSPAIDDNVQAALAE